jgi:hypothetical protein
VLPKIQLGVDALSLTPLTLNPLTLNPLTINPLTVNLGVPTITLNPVQLSVAITQIPSVRAHLPSNYCVGFSLLGIELFSLRLCGESQVITEPYQPNPCEICGPADLDADIPIKVQSRK